jgi:hypothetical protein
MGDVSEMKTTVTKSFRWLGSELVILTVLLCVIPWGCRNGHIREEQDPRVRQLALLSPLELCRAFVTGYYFDGRRRLFPMDKDILEPQCRPDGVPNMYRLDLVDLSVGSPIIFRKLTVALRDDNPRIRAIAATALGDLGNRDAVPFLLRQMERDEDWIPKHRMIGSLAQLEDPRAIPDLAKLADLTVGWDAYCMVDTICHIGVRNFFCPSATEAMEHFARSSDPRIAQCAKEYLDAYRKFSAEKTEKHRVPVKEPQAAH